MGTVLTPVKAIRAKCMECSCPQIVEVRECVIPTCPIYPYRMGRRPRVEGKPKKTMSPERKAKMMAAMAKRREQKLIGGF